ncbi:putative E3 ubiquitin-protein ligase ARI3 [Raphanus sativus]|uniref:RBR-type E3 ubiquitin transferase n=1 Tax=Raphanus sativus TaxID=3726 RepID=A0A6J0L9N3_RAPSA|nr:putative E3 ubiquitin-protein ligase ARI4 [Raphanus sativus]KAJ4877869.1 putative E3 ubiquitin-protein ligase ARI3 [Raphanus sativus]
MDEDYYLSYEEDEEAEEEEEDNDMYDNDKYQQAEQHEPEPSAKSTSQLITNESLVAAQKEVLARVMDLLTVKKSQARTLLIHYQWNVDKLVDVYSEKGREILFKTVGLTVFDRRPSLSESRYSLKKKKMSCEICMEDGLQSYTMTTMDCGHCFCNNCWKEHFTVKINEGMSKRIACMAYKCNAICDEDVVKKLVHPEVADKFDRFLAESYVDDNKRVKWCPSTPHCGNAIWKEDDDGEVECSCGHQFCFKCLCESHSPCSCLMWKLWSKKCEDESETLNWITVHTKMCPKCSRPVDRSYGCNLMTCICGQHFCWLCGGATGVSHDMTTIYGHSCGKFKEDKVKQMEMAKRDLERYTHYYHQYRSHKDSSKQEDKLRASVREKAASVSAKKDYVMHKDMTWVTDGADMLLRSRKVLSYTYVFAFYMFGEELFKKEMSDEEREMKKNLFENLQQQLIGYIERLSKTLNQPFESYTSDELNKMKAETINFRDVVKNLCKEMYNCVENDLLGTTPSAYNHKIASYSSDGIEKAIEFGADMVLGSSGRTSMSQQDS